MEEAISHVKDGMTVHIGGFLAVGTPENIITALIEKGVKDLTIVANDTGFPDKGIGRLVNNNQVKKSLPLILGRTLKREEKCKAVKWKWNWFHKGLWQKE